MFVTLLSPSPIASGDCVYGPKPKQRVSVAGGKRQWRVCCETYGGLRNM